ncbi:MAG: hypothetical protein IKI33_00880 [Eubacterium sp.]|nr:hypothetical protein [Eubacterium sp.]
MTYKIKKDPIGKIPKGQFIFWIIVRIAMICCAAYSFVHGDLVMGFESVFVFIFSHLWDMFQVLGNGSFIEDVPPIAQTALNFIILMGILFGSYLGWFDKISWYDEAMHCFTGIVCAVFAYDFSNVIQKEKGNCAITVSAMFALMFTCTIAVGWEFYEFIMDTVHGTNLQLAKEGAETAMYDLSKFRNEYGYLGLVDSMTDMMLNTVGGIIGMVGMIIYRKKHPFEHKKTTD